MTEPKLLDKVRIELCSKKYSITIEGTHTNWIKWFVPSHYKRNLNEMLTREKKAFIDKLVTNHQVSSPTQNQALQVILFPYKNILNNVVGRIETIKR